MQIIGLIECVILRCHTPLYLNVYGQAHQMSEMEPPPRPFLHIHSLGPVLGLKNPVWYTYIRVYVYLYV